MFNYDDDSSDDSFWDSQLKFTPTPSWTGDREDIVEPPLYEGCGTRTLPRRSEDDQSANTNSIIGDSGDGHESEGEGIPTSPRQLTSIPPSFVDPQPYVSQLSTGSMSDTTRLVVNFPSNKYSTSQSLPTTNYPQGTAGGAVNFSSNITQSDGSGGILRFKNRYQRGKSSSHSPDPINTHDDNFWNMPDFLTNQPTIIKAPQISTSTSSIRNENKPKNRRSNRNQEAQREKKKTIPCIRFFGPLRFCEHGNNCFYSHEASTTKDISTDDYTHANNNTCDISDYRYYRKSSHWNNNSNNNHHQRDYRNNNYTNNHRNKNWSNNNFINNNHQHEGNYHRGARNNQYTNNRHEVWNRSRNLPHKRTSNKGNGSMPSHNKSSMVKNGSPLSSTFVRSSSEGKSSHTGGNGGCRNPTHRNEPPPKTTLLSYIDAKFQSEYFESSIFNDNISSIDENEDSTAIQSIDNSSTGLDESSLFTCNDKRHTSTHNNLSTEVNREPKKIKSTMAAMNASPTTVSISDSRVIAAGGLAASMNDALQQAEERSAFANGSSSNAASTGRQLLAGGGAGGGGGDDDNSDDNHNDDEDDSSVNDTAASRNEQEQHDTNAGDDIDFDSSMTMNEREGIVYQGGEMSNAVDDITFDGNITSGSHPVDYINAIPNDGVESAVNAVVINVDDDISISALDVSSFLSDPV
jgi:hypothetical protein